MIHLLAPKDKNKWNPIWFKCFESIQTLPYKIKIWNDEEINNEIKLDDEDFYNNYLNQLDPIYKFDYIRYIILERYGGIYMDMDVEIKINFLEWLDPSKIYLAEGIKNCLVSNHIMISPPNYLYWHDIKQQLKYRVVNQFDKCKTSSYYTIETVGPIGLSYVIAKDKYTYTPLSRWHFGSDNTDFQICTHHTTHEWAKNKPIPPGLVVNYDN